MTTLNGIFDHDRYCAEVLAEGDRFRQAVRGADLKTPVPTCPEWTLEDLVRHVGGAYRWADRTVRTRATEMVPFDAVPDSQGPPADDPAALDAWLAEGARLAAEAMREAGPDAPIWSWAPGQNSAFWPRRMVHETVIHRADAVAATGGDFPLDPELAADTIEEWTQLICLISAIRPDHELRGFMNTGRTLHLHATDTPPHVPADWLLDFTAATPTYHHTPDHPTVTLQAPTADLLRVYYRRLPLDTPGVEVTGDRTFLEEWLAAATFA
ncbi:maleylpyruvate isomerase N-terminal domain-containing protein [Streptomyces sp. NPDC052496]|uniref:maleylpyruvate isomerase N-terminal domain-containing protein n=1 Tax=Streptomyces sp. NPDC052496 TaxID=3154951 RepID=UPI00342D0482